MHIAQLTDYVGVPLFQRDGRGVRLTPEGEHLLEAAELGLGTIEACLHDLRAAGARLPTVSVTPSFLQLWLQPRIADFERRHPAARWRLIASRSVVRVGDGSVDRALRFGPGKWKGTRAELLMDEALLPVCAPSVAQAAGTLRPGGRLPAKLLLHGADPWTLWSEQAPLARRSGIVVDDILTVVQAAVEGRGITLARKRLVDRHLAGRTLVALGPPIPHRWSYYWVSPQGARTVAADKQFCDWVRRHAEA